MSEHIDLQQSLDAQLPRTDPVVVIAGAVDDHVPNLWDEELSAVSGAVPKRQREFATGRHLARQAMARLGLPPQGIPRGADRAPLWPQGCIGSITHAQSVAVVAVAASGSIGGIGIDLEENQRVTPELWDKLFTAGERARYQQLDSRWPGLLFSAKEAVYKAVNPVVGNFIGFHEVEVDADWKRSQFTMRYVGDHAPNRIMERGQGHFVYCGRYVFTLFMIS